MPKLPDPSLAWDLAALSVVAALTVMEAVGEAPFDCVAEAAADIERQSTKRGL